MLLLIFCIFIFAYNIYACPQGTIQGLDNNTCYSFSTSASAFSDATQNCNNAGGYLVSSPDAFTDNFLLQQAGFAFANTTAMFFWLGGTNQRPEQLTGWRWLDGLKFSYTNWMTGKHGDTHWHYPRFSGSGWIDGHANFLLFYLDVFLKKFWPRFFKNKVTFVKNFVGQMNRCTYFLPSDEWVTAFFVHFPTFIGDQCHYTLHRD